MRHHLHPRSLPLALLFLAIASSALPVRAEPPRQIRITVVEGDSCVVEGTAIPCVDLLRHLREVVKLPAGSNVRVRVEPTTSYEFTAKVFKLLLKSEYKTPIGYINVTDFPDQ
jgi:biopolymer transport protein ExbD